MYFGINKAQNLFTDRIISLSRQTQYLVAGQLLSYVLTLLTNLLTYLLTYLIYYLTYLPAYITD